MKHILFKFLQSINSKVGAGTKFFLVSIFFMFLSYMIIVTRAENLKQRTNSDEISATSAQSIPFLPQFRLLHLNKN